MSQPKPPPKPPAKKGPGGPAQGGVLKPPPGSPKSGQGQGPGMGGPGGGKPLSTAKPFGSHKTVASVLRDAKNDGIERIEDQVFAVPGMKDVAEPEMFRNYLEKVSPTVRMPDTSRKILEAFANIDVTADKLAGVIKANPYYESFFLAVIQTMSTRQDIPSANAGVILLGMQNTRDLIVALQVSRSVTRGHATFDSKTGKLVLSPKETLKYALKVEEYLGKNKDAYPDTAYGAAVLFDIMMLVAAELAADKKAAMGFVDATYAHGLRTAKLGLELAKLVTDFGFKKYVFAACLVHDIGKIAMAILNPDYLKFLDDCAKKGVPRKLRDYAEEMRFGCTHAMLGGLICRAYPMTRPIYEAIMHHHDPAVIKLGAKNAFQLAAVTCLATNIANNFKKIENAQDPTFATWKGLDLKDLKIDPKGIVAAANKVIASG